MILVQSLAFAGDSHYSTENISLSLISNSDLAISLNATEVKQDVLNLISFLIQR